jgi:hypothetical protein
MADQGNYVVLYERPDDDYLGYLTELRLDLPEILTADRQDGGLSQAALASPGLLARLAAIAAVGGVLLPHGVSTTEERLADAAGMPLAAPAASVCKAVNSKVYSRQLADRLGLRQPRGWACGSVAGWDDGVARARALVRAGRPVVVKDAYGVSGKGLLMVREERRLEAVHGKVVARARRAGNDRVALVIEEWVPKQVDLNYQFTVERGGAVRFDFVKRAITEHGVHRGHIMPAGLDRGQLGELHRVAAAVGGELAREGYFGVAGVDALIEPDGGLFPIIEINARHNMSTYQARLQERFVGAGMTALARHFPLRLTRRLPFAALRVALRGLELTEGGTGLLVSNFAPVNAVAPAADAATPFTGRLYLLLVAAHADELARLEDEVARRLTGLEVLRP